MQKIVKKRPKKKQETCVIHGCNREVLALHMCTPCYHRVRYWSRKSTRDKVKRLHNLKIYENTMDVSLGNVAVLERKTG